MVSEPVILGLAVGGVLLLIGGYVLWLDLRVRALVAAGRPGPRDGPRPAPPADPRPDDGPDHGPDDGPDDGTEPPQSFQGEGAP